MSAAVSQKRAALTLERLELHLDSLERYNDPFEGTFLLIDEKKLKSHGVSAGLF